MPTKICRGDPDEGFEHEIVGYCLEPPIEVFEQIWRGHEVIRYKDIWEFLPSLFPYARGDLLILEEDSPPLAQLLQVILLISV